jgi:hypothetical protein
MAGKTRRFALLLIFFSVLLESCQVHILNSGSIGINIANHTYEKIRVSPVENLLGVREINARTIAGALVEQNTMITAEGEISHKIQVETFSEFGVPWVVVW